MTTHNWRSFHYFVVFIDFTIFTDFTRFTSAENYGKVHVALSHWLHFIQLHVVKKHTNGIQCFATWSQIFCFSIVNSNVSGVQLVGEDADEIGFRFSVQKNVWNELNLNHIAARTMTECREIEMRKLYTFPLCELRANAELLKYRKKFQKSNWINEKRVYIHKFKQFTIFFFSRFLSRNGKNRTHAAQSWVLLWCNQALPFWEFNERLNVDF